MPSLVFHCGTGMGYSLFGRDVAKYKINILLHAGEFPRAEDGKARGGFGFFRTESWVDDGRSPWQETRDREWRLRQLSYQTQGASS